jgi:hypothetical protein
MSLQTFEIKLWQVLRTVRPKILLSATRNVLTALGAFYVISFLATLRFFYFVFFFAGLIGIVMLAYAVEACFREARTGKEVTAHVSKSP